MESVLQESSKARLKNSVDYDIIMFALPRWDGNYSSTAYSLAKALSKHTRVFYIDNPFTLKYFLTDRNSEQIQRRKQALIQGKNIFTKPDSEYPGLVAVTPRLTLPVNWMPPGFLYNAFSKVNDQIVSEAINKTIRVYGIRKFVFINSFNPLFGKYLSFSVKPFLKVYHAVDDISQSEYLDKHGVLLEREAMKGADLTIVTSSELKRLSERHTKHVYLLPNAANVRLFQKALLNTLPMPEEIQRLPKDSKIITYAGNICHRIDYELLVKIAKHNPDKVLLMIGPFANDNYRKSGLDKLANVVFTGKKNLEALPSYLKYSHCCIIPFLCNQLTRSIYPLKVNEYLSTGKPVVTTNFSEDILSFRNVIYTSENHEEFLKNIDNAIANDKEESRLERLLAARDNNWEDRARQFTGIVEEFLQWRI